MKKKKAIQSPEKMGKKMKEEQEERTLEEMEARLEVMREHLTVHMIEAERLCPSPFQRSMPEEEKTSFINSLCDSIRRFGLIQPLAVRRICKDCSSVGGIFCVLDGSLRLEALKKLGVTKVPCVICDLQAYAATGAALTSSIQQKGLNIFEIGRAIRQYCDEQCVTVKEAAERLSIRNSFAQSCCDAAEMLESEEQICLGADLPESVIAEIAAIKDERVRKPLLLESVKTVKGLRDKFSAIRSGGSGKQPGKLILRDIRPVYNSIERLVSLLRLSGSAAFYTKQETGECYRIVLEIPKKSYHTVVSGDALQNDPLFCAEYETV